jgi:pimeloyl-ACP methyl ester carboxylesterase
MDAVISNNSSGPDVVLVHGAWSGSYAFRYVRSILRDAGREVFTPSLTGIGERSHLAHPGVNLTTHVRDVVNTVLYEDLSDIVLLGFSYGGMVVSGALDHIGDRVRHLVYLDAAVPSDGQSASDVFGTGQAPAMTLGQPWQVPPRPRAVNDPELQVWSDARRSMQPAGTFQESVHMSRRLEEWELSLTYIKATADAAEASDSAFWRAAAHAKDSPRWAHHEIATHHLVPYTHPAELSQIVLDLD